MFSAGVVYVTYFFRYVERCYIYISLCMYGRVYVVIVSIFTKYNYFFDTYIIYNHVYYKIISYHIIIFYYCFFSRFINLLSMCVYIPCLAEAMHAACMGSIWAVLLCVLKYNP